MGDIASIAAEANTAIPRSGFIADQIEMSATLRPGVEARSPTAAQLTALWQFWGTALMVGKADGFTTLTVTLPTALAASLYKTIGNLPADYEYASFDEDAAEVARWKTVSAWVTHQIALRMASPEVEGCPRVTI